MYFPTLDLLIPSLLKSLVTPDPLAIVTVAVEVNDT